MRRRIYLAPIVLFGLVALLAAGCVAPPVAGPGGPQIMVTRVPLDIPPAGAVKVASAGTPSEIGDGIQPVGPGIDNSTFALTSTITSTLQSTRTLSETSAGSRRLR